MKNLKVYLTLFVSILFLSQNLWAQGLKMEVNRSLKTQKAIETKTKVQDRNEISPLEEKNTENSVNKSNSSETTKPAIQSGITITNQVIENRAVKTSGSVEMTPAVKSGSNSTLEQKEVKPSGNSASPMKGQTTLVTQQNVLPATTQKASVPKGNQTVLMNVANQSDLFYGDAQIQTKLKRSNIVLYKEYIKERQTIASVLNRVEANTFKNNRERTKYAQLLKAFKQKYNF